MSIRFVREEESYEKGLKSNKSSEMFFFLSFIVDWSETSKLSINELCQFMLIAMLSNVQTMCTRPKLLDGHI